FVDRGKFTDAAESYRRALAIRQTAQGADHPDVAEILNNLAILEEIRGDHVAALTHSREASTAVIAHARIDTPFTYLSGETGSMLQKRVDYFSRHVAHLEAVRKGSDPDVTLGPEAFWIAQWATHSSAAGAVQQMGLRFAAGNGGIASLVRER